MAIPIPDDFDVMRQNLDANETYVRDVLRVNIENWARFRHTIDLGLHAENLHSDEPIAEDVKEAYRELGKSHYAVVCALGHTRIGLKRVGQAFHELSPLYWDKSLKDFYYHTGRILDNLARLIYILNASDSASATNRRGYIRHWIDWGQLERHVVLDRYDGGEQLREIHNMRNVLTHSWDCPTVVGEDRVPRWPVTVRTERDHLWFYDEREQMIERYQEWVPIFPMVFEDFQFLERFQNDVFGGLVVDVGRFEENYGVEIR